MAALQKAPKQVGPRSLQRMCLAVALRNVASITDLGELPFETAKPILKLIENPAQLHELEVNCPQLTAEPEKMGGIWSRLLHKKFPRWDEKGYAIDDGMSWYEIFVAVKDAVDRDNAEATANLQRQLAGFDRDKEGHAARLVNNRALLSKIPRMASAATGRRRGASSAASQLSFSSGSRTKMTSGQSVMRRARREAREISKISMLSTPTGALRAAKGQITKAPEAMVHDHRIARNPEVVIRAPKKRSIAAMAGSPPPGNHDVEARLLALKSKGSAPAKPPSKLSGARPTSLARPVKPLTSGQPAASDRSKVVVRPARSVQPASDDEFDDDDLFGDGPRKKPCLTVDDLEQPSSLARPAPRKKGKGVDIFMRPKKR